MNKLKLLYQVYKNQGARYVSYRTFYELSRKSGLLKKRFPVNPPFRKFISLENWRRHKPAFVFDRQSANGVIKIQSKVLEEKYVNFIQGKILYFNAHYQEVGTSFNWMINPDTGYQYDSNKHWTEINDFTPEAGDIKFVWEKSRFSFILDLIRYDHHCDTDCAELVFSSIDSWMDANPINQGPNYKCSQETSLRILHWTFALYYYADHKSLTESRFDRIMHFIYWQLHHVRENIQFSRICVRNNHAVTETMMLYFSGLLFPFMPKTKEWSSLGKKWIEEEIAYQVYPDGTYLQFSHNYQRVLMQLLTLSQAMAALHHQTFSNTFLERSKGVVNYIRAMIDPDSGELPNYGANDGALFFRMNDDDYRNYSSQLNALYFVNYGKPLYDHHQEDIQWFLSGVRLFEKPIDSFQLKPDSSFPDGGIYCIRQKNSFTFFKCTSYKDRPSHADNLHIDFWWEGKNLMRDAGTYKYYTDKELASYFPGTKAHNTVTLDNEDQMLKGQRFIWFHWTHQAEVSWKNSNDSFRVIGKIKAFDHVSDGITHERQVHIERGYPLWIITDALTRPEGHTMKQWWHPAPQFFDHFTIRAVDENGREIPMQKHRGYYSSYYGIKEEVTDICFETKGKMISTYIEKL